MNLNHEGDGKNRCHASLDNVSDRLQSRTYQRFPNVPFLFRWVQNVGGYCQGEILEMDPYPGISQKSAKLATITSTVSLTQVHENLTHLGTTEQMLLRCGEKVSDRTILNGKLTGKTIVKKALMPETISPPVEREHAFRCHLRNIIGRYGVQDKG